MDDIEYHKKFEGSTISLKVAATPSSFLFLPQDRKNKKNIYYQNLSPLLSSDFSFKGIIRFLVLIRFFRHLKLQNPSNRDHFMRWNTKWTCFIPKWNIYRAEAAILKVHTQREESLDLNSKPDPKFCPRNIKTP